MISKDIAKAVLQKALSTGGNFAELFIENTKQNSISVINGKMDKSMSGVDFGLGLRIFNGFNAIYAYTNDLSESSLLKLADTAAAAIHGKANNVIINFAQVPVQNIHPVKIMPSSVPKKEIVDILKSASASAFSFNPLISQTSSTYIDELQDVVIINSEGLWIEDRRVRTRASVWSVASDGNEKQAGTHSPGASCGFEIFQNIDFDDLARDSANIAVTMLKADYAPKAKIPVIIDKGFGGVIFHEACGHSLEATAVAKDSSEFCGKLGTQIASTKVTAIDDGTIPNFWGSINIDDEGTKTKRTVLIENGILKSFLVDRLNGERMGMASTGSSRRQSYKFAPTSRMTNTFIQAGDDLEKDIIASTECGLYAKKMGGGSVQTATGDFNFAVSEGYMIRNGKIAEPVRGATLIGKGSEVLMNIDKVGTIETQDAGVCGSESGAVPTNVGQPMIRVSELTVGGQN